MWKNRLASGLLLLMSVFCLAGCKNMKADQMTVGGRNKETLVSEENMEMENIENVLLTNEIRELENGLSAVKYEGDYGFDAFLSAGGASSDREVIGFLAENLLSGMDIGFSQESFGCSTISVKSEDGDFLFGRNFDWNSCNAMVVAAYPENGYASISTVNMDFVNQGAGGGITGMALQMDQVKVLAALYAPLDGMNEKGLAVSVNMIQDGADINQDSDRPDITTTTVIRLLLDQAADVDEALALLKQYDMHASMGMMVHFALADNSGRSVVVEYIENEMVVTDTPVVTNFYLAEGKKHGIGTEQSHERYEILMGLLGESERMDMAGVRDALDHVSKDNFGEFESTEWSIVFNQTDGQAVYYHRENYGKGYAFTIE